VTCAVDVKLNKELLVKGNGDFLEEKISSQLASYVRKNVQSLLNHVL